MDVPAATPLPHQLRFLPRCVVLSGVMPFWAEIGIFRISAIEYYPSTSHRQRLFSEYNYPLFLFCSYIWYSRAILFLPPQYLLLPPILLIACLYVCLSSFAISPSSSCLSVAFLLHNSFFTGWFPLFGVPSDACLSLSSPSWFLSFSFQFSLFHPNSAGTSFFYFPLPTSHPL